MTTREYIATIREQWAWVVAGLLLGIVAAAAAIFLVPRQYAASATMILIAQPSADGSAISRPEVSGQRLAVYTQLLRSRRLAAGAISDLQLSLTPDQLIDRIAVQSIPNSALLTATVTNDSSEQAVQIANAVVDEFVKNVTQIEQPSDPTRRPGVVAQLFEAAKPPAELVAPRPVMYGIAGVVLGLVVGLTVALIRQTGPRIRTRAQLEETLGAPVLGTLGRDRKLARRPLVLNRAPSTPPAEQFRQLRTNLQLTEIQGENKMILVTSATAGEGRSTTVCNLGLVMAEAGIKVIIVDADLRRPRVAKYLQCDDGVGLTSVLAGRVALERAVQRVRLDLDVLTTGPLPPNPSELLGSRPMARLLPRLRSAYNVVLVDTAPLLPVTDASVLATRADGVLMVVRRGKVTTEDVMAAENALNAVSARILGSVLTVVPSRGKQDGGDKQDPPGRQRRDVSESHDLPTSPRPPDDGHSRGGLEVNAEDPALDQGRPSR